MPCPYIFCSATVEAKWMRTRADNPNAQMLMIPEHDMRNSIVQGPCPAGMMWIPLDEYTRAILAERARVHGRLIGKHLANPPKSVTEDPRAREGGMYPIRPVGPSGIPHRLGREPATEADQGDWNPPRGQEPERPVPPHTGGGPFTGRGTTGMASITELIGMTNEANASTGEALGAIAQCSQALDSCLGAIERAKALVAHVLDDSHAQTMTEYHGLLNQAEDNVRSVHGPLEEALGQLGAGMEKGEQFIGNMMG